MKYKIEYEQRDNTCEESDDCEEPNQTCDINKNICVSVKEY